MAKRVFMSVLLAALFSLSACKASTLDIKKADDYLAALSSFKSEDASDKIDELAELSATVINLDAKAFDFKNGWYNLNNSSKEYLFIFISHGSLTVFKEENKVTRLDYTFCVDSTRDMYDAADNLISLYGEPASVYLNGAPSSHSEVDQAASSSDDPELTYSYVWKTELQGQPIYVYEAYYLQNGIHFSYVIVSSFLKLSGTSQDFWNN